MNQPGARITIFDLIYWLVFVAGAVLVGNFGNKHFGILGGVIGAVAGWALVFVVFYLLRNVPDSASSNEIDNKH